MESDVQPEMKSKIALPIVVGRSVVCFTALAVGQVGAGNPTSVAASLAAVIGKLSALCRKDLDMPAQYSEEVGAGADRNQWRCKPGIQAKRA